MPRKVIGLSFNEDQQQLLKNLMEKLHESNITSFFVHLMAQKEQEITRRGPGRPRNAEESTAPEDTALYLWPDQDSHNNKGRYEPKEDIEWYFNIKNLPIPPDYFEKNIKL